jgi:hypothetical protein
LNDIISRYVSAPEQTEILFEKMMSEISESKFFGLKDYWFDFIDPIMKSKTITLYRRTEKYPAKLFYYTNQKFKLRTGANVDFMIEDLFKRYPSIEPIDVVKIVLKYHNARNSSGTNWCPVETYGNLKSSKWKDYSKIEVFASPFNHQNRDCPENDPLVETIFTCSPYDMVLPHIKGQFPFGIVDHILDLNSDKVLLLMGPIYTEHYILETFEILNKIAEDERLENMIIKCLVSLPKWDDIYQSDIFLSYCEKLDIQWTPRSKIRVKNMDIDMNVKLASYSLEISLL